MFDLDHWREIWNALSANKLRTCLTAFGVFWGILMLMIMLGAGNGLENGVKQDFADNATNSFWVWSRSTSMPFRGLPHGRPLQLTHDDTVAIRALVPEVGVLSPRTQLGGWRGGNNVTRGKNAGAFSVMGDTPEILAIEPVRLTGGRFLNRLDLADRRKVAVIGPRVRQVLFGADEPPLGDHIRINGVYFKVIGTYEPINADDEEQNDSIYVPLTTFQHAFNFGNRVDWLAVTSKIGIPASVAEEQVLALLRQRHRVHPDDERAFGSFNLEQEYNEVQGLFTGIEALVWIVGIGTLAAGVIGVSNIMLVIVRERTHEIGVRRAIGARPWSVMGQIVLEAILLTSLAGYLGLVAGVGLVELLAHWMANGAGQLEAFRHPGVAPASAIQALGLVVLAGILAGLIPARRAVSVNPVDALRTE
ncbi:MAG TPA: ABC transporter permease [Candidatus Polarisedimenticolaceae bacterium]|nr:ABC transporter permease [Candidatus Polarisedimenticolaceae bacterium]